MHFVFSCTEWSLEEYCYIHSYILCDKIVYFCLADSHHKLIRWHLVTHAGIDGYSRLIVYLSCSNNNKASTMYSLFLEGVNNIGLPHELDPIKGLRTL